MRNIWRLEGGWYDGMPSHLKPATKPRRRRRSRRWQAASGKVVARALEKLGAGDLALASHLADWAVARRPETNPRIRPGRRSMRRVRDAESSTMAHGIFHSAALESAKKADIAPPEDKRSF